MKKCLVSKYTKPDAIDSIKADIVRFNKIKRYAFSLIVKMGGDKPLPDGTSIHIHLKDKFNVNDHFANAAKREAVASYKSAMECLKLNAETLESRIKQENRKLSSEQKRLDHLKEEKESLINRSLQRKAGSKRKVKFKSYRGGNESETNTKINTFLRCSILHLKLSALNAGYTALSREGQDTNMNWKG